ncbi:PAS domain-containing protein [Emcibacter sp.]|uniref:PAS domain-containing protein n=1 Tax=Emcibacter sp. TaxID=1979954 RepID=UPI002AA938CB|nr:PAS domain-containing protein [Emcibacter sp.]
MFITPEFYNVWEYWNNIRGDRIIPERKKLNPADLSDYLGWLAILDWKGDELNMRLLGSDIIKEVGVNFSGNKLFEKGLPRVTDFAWSNFKKIFNFPCGFQLVFVERKTSGLLVEAAILLLPLAVEGIEDNQILCYRRHLGSVGYDSKYPDIVQLGINRMSYIDLGCGVPDIDLEEHLLTTRFIPNEKKSFFRRLLLS